ncbi:MAG: metal ABC transporter ATP-binding protein [Desulfurococcales archaeon]|nr:metal ABC transporter ATP-binding protein [Desulfurococcales archaeon]
MTSLAIENLTVTLGGSRVLDDINLSFEGPGLYLILGPNGAGKTTLFRSILGLIRPDNGRIRVDGEDVTGRPERAGNYIAYTPQRPPIGKFTPFTPWELVCTALSLRTQRWPRIRCTSKRRVEESLRLVGLDPGVWHKRLPELSGGTLMRAYIARSVALDKEILLMDEPLAPIDPAWRARIAELLGSLARRKLILVSLHDYVLLEGLARGVVLLNRRVVAAGRPEEVLKVDVLRSVYGPSVVEVREHVHIADYHG